MTDSQVEKIRMHETVRVVVNGEFLGEYDDGDERGDEPALYAVLINNEISLVCAKDIKSTTTDWARRRYRKHDIVKVEVRPGIFELDICDGETNDGHVMVRGLPKPEWPHYTRVKLVCAEHLRDDRKEVERG